jgi:signal transduction histidine kinase
MIDRRKTWTLPIRRWLMLALVVLFVIPVFGSVLVGSILVWRSFDKGGNEPAISLLREGATRWSDPAWQTTTAATLGAKRVDFVLFSGGQEIFRSTTDPLEATTIRGGDYGPPWWVNDTGGRVGQRLVIDGTDPLLTADLYVPVGDGPTLFWVVPLVGGSLLLLTLAVMGWIVGRMLVRPLAATGRAAGLVASGNLDISLPSSRVSEVEHVNSAFESMSAGLRESIERQAALEQERRFFIGAVVHDLRTPLFSLRGYLEGMEKGLADTPNKRAHYIATAQEKAAALDRLVNDLFDYTRIEYLDQPPATEILDLAALLQQIVDGLQPQADAQGLVLIFEAERSPELVEADPHLLTRVVENLLDNALRYTPTGGSIRISCGFKGQEVWFKVSDTGPGIPQADLPNLFTPLYRGETSRNRRTGGAGLGLTIARRIMLAHGGDLRVRNDPKGGAVFTGHLQRARVETN